MASSTSTSGTWRSSSLRRREVRDLILNHASVAATEADRGQVASWLRGAIEGMGSLLNDSLVRPALLMRQDLHSTFCLPGYSLFQVCQDMCRKGARDEYGFFLGLAGKAPWLDTVAPEKADRFRACEGRGLPRRDGEPLMLCVVLNGISVGFPSDSRWDRNRITVRFDELLPDGAIEEAEEQVDNLTRAVHARPIAERQRAALGAVSDPAELWRNRHAAFPNLIFGPGVEADLRRLGGHLSTVAGKLRRLDDAVEAWRASGGPTPGWGREVTRESERVRNDPSLLEARRFESSRGGRRIFEWHARYGSAGRIHLRLDKRELEIGYIGPHLPL